MANKKEGCCNKGCNHKDNEHHEHEHQCCCGMHNHNDSKLLLADDEIEQNFDDVSDDLKQYYSDISLKLIELIKEEKYQEAIDIIDSELEQPYVPNSILVSFMKTKKELEIQAAESEYNAELEDMSKFEMWNKIYDEKKHKIDIVFLNLLIEKFGEEFDELDFAVINKIFKDKAIDNVDKSHLLMFLLSMDPQYKFTIYNNFTKKETQFIVSDIAQSFIPREETIKKIEDIFMKDPSKLEIAYNLLQLLSAQYIPESMPYSDDMIANSIASMVNSFFGESLEEENEITKLLFNLLDK